MIAKELRQIINNAISEAVEAGELPTIEAPDFVLERPRHKSHGDWATNAAMALSGGLDLKPREVAGILARRLEGEADTLQSVEVAGPGFINFTLSRDRILQELTRVASEGEAAGSSIFPYFQGIHF